jgi:hypothetical protein
VSQPAPELRPSVGSRSEGNGEGLAGLAVSDPCPYGLPTEWSVVVGEWPSSPARGFLRAGERAPRTDGTVSCPDRRDDGVDRHSYAMDPAPPGLPIPARITAPSSPPTPVRGHCARPGGLKARPSALVRLARCPGAGVAGHAREERATRREGQEEGRQRTDERTLHGRCAPGSRSVGGARAGAVQPTGRVREAGGSRTSQLGVASEAASRSASVARAVRTTSEASALQVALNPHTSLRSFHPNVGPAASRHPLCGAANGVLLRCEDADLAVRPSCSDPQERLPGRGGSSRSGPLLD